MAYTFVVLSGLSDPRRLIDIDNVVQAVAAWHTHGLRSLEDGALDFHVDTGSGDLYAEIDLDPSLISWYVEGVAKDAFGDGTRPNVAISWTASGDSPDLAAMREITTALLGDADFVIWDEIGGARPTW